MGSTLTRKSLNIIQGDRFLPQLFVASQVAEACVDGNPVEPSHKSFILIQGVKVGENFHKNIPAGPA